MKGRCRRIDSRLISSQPRNLDHYILGHICLVIRRINPAGYWYGLTAAFGLESENTKTKHCDPSWCICEGARNSNSRAVGKVDKLKVTRKVKS